MYYCFHHSREAIRRSTKGKKNAHTQGTRLLGQDKDTVVHMADTSHVGQDQW